jgi:dipeptidyl aminopeptidase/acylaminoacyl peptidase
MIQKTQKVQGKKQPVEFEVGEDTLRGSFFIPDGKGPFPAVIFFHSSESKGETYFELAERLAQEGILGFAFNYRGCGISDGNIKEQTLGMGIEDVKAALKLFLSREEVDKQRIGISGSSYGGFLASLIASDYNFKSMVLVVPAAYAPSSMSLIHGAFIREMEDFTKSISYQEVEKFRGDLLIFEAEFDDVLLKGMVKKYFESAKNTQRKEFYLLKDTKHRLKLFPKAKEIMLKKAIDWFAETL